MQYVEFICIICQKSHFMVFCYAALRGVRERIQVYVYYSLTKKRGPCRVQKSRNDVSVHS
ncbi:hypothetical protein BMS3Abin13_00036 [bacterium BMS3Abin13]|nr:hypothetical protein BMS3Abin13_00029 [bacterium BMS3Abin13]GBE11761.1 hypothetical protein BMS3Abin13_00036 [bacterium BMS3Abin13]